MKQFIAAMALTALMTPGLSAQERHPHYLHALSDLRFARFLIDRNAEYNVWVDQKEAVNRIDKAIGEIKRASIDDHKDLNAHPAPDPSWDRVGRLHKAAELLESCERDLKFEEDDYKALGWRAEAIVHVHEALMRTRKAMEDKRRDERM